MGNESPICAVQTRNRAQYSRDVTKRAEEGWAGYRFAINAPLCTENNYRTHQHKGRPLAANNTLAFARSIWIE